MDIKAEKCFLGLFGHENYCKNCLDLDYMNYLGPKSEDFFGSRGLGCMVPVGAVVKTKVVVITLDRSSDALLDPTTSSMDCHLLDSFVVVDFLEMDLDFST